MAEALVTVTHGFVGQDVARTLVRDLDRVRAIATDL